MDKIQTGMTVYDVGANKGQMTLLFSKLVGVKGRVIAFEPAPQEYASLQRNVRINGLSNVQLIDAAVSDCNGRATFTYSAQRATQGKLLSVEPTYTNEEGEQLNVPSITLDAVLERGTPPPDLIKVDVEGAARLVFLGATKLLNDVCPAIYVELHGPEEQRAIRDQLLRRGYVAETTTGEVVSDPTAGWYSPLWCYKPN
jgi:FkbM family methyltransferase